MAALKIKDFKLVFVKVCLIGIPSYAMAFTTEEIVYVVPTIAMMLFITNSIETGSFSNRNRIEDDNVMGDNSTDNAGGSESSAPNA